LNTLLIGLGSVGLEYDLILKNKFLSHAKTVNDHKRLKLKAVVDLDKKKLLRFKKRYKSELFTSLDKALKFSNFEFVIVSVSTQNLYSVFNKLKQHKSMKYILLEKPGASNYIQFKKIYNFCKKKNINLFLNYNRTYIDLFNRSLEFLKKTKYFKITHTYSRGLKTNASHFLNLLFLQIDLPINIYVLSKKQMSGSKDFNLNILLKYKNGEIYLISNNTDVFLNETLIFSNDRKIRIDFNENRIELFKTKKFNLLKGYKKFHKQKEKIFSIKNYQKNTLKAVIKNFDNQKLIEKLNQSNIKTLKFISLVERTLKSHKNRLIK
tara:strand:+ start:1797 stop:2762 length:966 start_codon:yes stop_codon:yes gene_type:complete